MTMTPQEILATSSVLRSLSNRLANGDVTATDARRIIDREVDALHAHAIDALLAEAVASRQEPTDA